MFFRTSDTRGDRALSSDARDRRRQQLQAQQQAQATRRCVDTPAGTLADGR